jgi:hypothetical protein
VTTRELDALRRAVIAAPDDDSAVERYRRALDRVYGRRPPCARCGLSTHMARGRLNTKQYASWTELAGEDLVRELGYKDNLHLVGWRCRICNIVSLTTVERRDLTFDWVDDAAGA